MQFFNKKHHDKVCRVDDMPRMALKKKYIVTLSPAVTYLRRVFLLNVAEMAGQASSICSGYILLSSSSAFIPHSMTCTIAGSNWQADAGTLAFRKPRCTQFAE